MIRTPRLLLLALGMVSTLFGGTAELHAEDLHYYRFGGRVQAGQTFVQTVRPDLVFALLPTGDGWQIALLPAESSRENLARLTPPLDGVSPLRIAGWHFRNRDNSGPNEPGPKSVNAPGKQRRFIFAPEVAQISPGAPLDAGFLERIGSRGQGELQIDNLALGHLVLDEPPYIAALAFTVELVVAWPPPALE